MQGTTSYRGVGPQEEYTYFCGVDYREEQYMIKDSWEEQPSLLKRIDERIRILEEEEVELISVPVPDFGDSDPADIVHDFLRVSANNWQSHRP